MSAVEDAVATYVLGAPGVGTITIGAAVPGARTPTDAGLVDGGVYSCRSESPPGGANWEVGDYTWSASGQTWTRTTIYESSLGGISVPLGSDAVVFVTPGKRNLFGLGTPLVGLPSASSLSRSDVLYLVQGGVNHVQMTLGYLYDNWASLAPSTGGSLLMEDNTSHILLEDNTSKLLMES
jgi:hypothetical protein